MTEQEKQNARKNLITILNLLAPGYYVEADLSKLSLCEIEAEVKKYATPGGDCPDGTELCDCGCCPITELFSQSDLSKEMIEKLETWPIKKVSR